MSVVRWPNLVNQRILDSTNITVGDTGFVDNQSDSKNFSERYLTSLYSPDTYSVSMDFDWLKRTDDMGNEVPEYIGKELNPAYKYAKTEYERFIHWYKFVHKRGVNPFEFPSIAKFNINGSTEMARYKITSAISQQKSGFCFRVTMTWEEVFAYTINLTQRKGTIDHTEAENGVLYVYWNALPSEEFYTISSSSKICGSSYQICYVCMKKPYKY